MNEEKQNILKRPWPRWWSPIGWFLLLFVVFFLVFFGLALSANPGMRFPGLFGSSLIFAVCASLAGVGVVFLIRWLRHWRNVRRFLFVAACFATLTAIFYAEENRRGKRAWEKCKRELESKGEVLDWSAYIPAPVPDDQNVFKAPKIAEWFVRKGWHQENLGGGGQNELMKRISTASFAEFAHKRRSNAVAEVTFLASNASGDIERADLLLRYEGHALNLATTNDFSRPQAATIPVIQMEDVPVSMAISNLAHQANLNFEFDSKLLAGWGRTGGKPREPHISLTWENISAHRALLALLDTYHLAWVENPKTGIGRITALPDPGPTDSNSRVVVQQDVREQLKRLIRSRFEGSPAIQVVTNLSQVTLLKFAAGELPPIEPVRIVVLSEEHPGEQEVKDFFPRDLPQTALRGGSGWRAEAAGSNAFRVFLATESVCSAADYLAWSDPFAPEFAIIRDALKRPESHLGGDYHGPHTQPIPDFVCVRSLAQILAQRAQCYLLLSQPENALRELTLMGDLHGLLKSRPITLVAAMIDGAIAWMYVGIIGDGFRLQAWQEPQLIALQKQLQQISLPAAVAESLRTGRAGTCQMFLVISAREFVEQYAFPEPKKGLCAKLTDPTCLLLQFAPRGWVYQNVVTIATLEQGANIEIFDPQTQSINPSQATRAIRESEKLTARWMNPFSVLARFAVPNFVRAMQVTARNQTLANQTFIVCGLERYHRAHGDYPETLDALAPQFVEKLPRDIIGGQPLHYRRTADGKFILYSVGWNETDDGGQPGPTKSGSLDYAAGDWVWELPVR